MCEDLYLKQRLYEDIVNRMNREYNSIQYQHRDLDRHLELSLKTNYTVLY